MRGFFQAEKTLSVFFEGSRNAVPTVMMMPSVRRITVVNRIEIDGVDDPAGVQEGDEFSKKFPYERILEFHTLRGLARFELATANELNDGVLSEGFDGGGLVSNMCRRSEGRPIGKINAVVTHIQGGPQKSA